MTPTLALYDLRRDFDVAVLTEFYREVLLPSFPPDELDPFNVLKRGLMSKDDVPVHALLALGANRAVLGGIVGYKYPNSGVLLIGYLAVKANVRGRGVGSWLMNSASREWYPKIGGELVVSEVEDPRYHRSPDQDSFLRLKFYERAGGRVVATPYFQPRVSPQASRVYHMLLVALFVAPATLTDNGSAIKAKILRTWLAEYFEASEGPSVPKSDPEVLSLLRFLEEKDQLDLLPLSRYEEVPTGPPT